MTHHLPEVPYTTPKPYRPGQSLHFRWPGVPRLLPLDLDRLLQVEGHVSMPAKQLAEASDRYGPQPVMSGSGSAHLGYHMHRPLDSGCGAALAPSAHPDMQEGSLSCP